MAFVHTAHGPGQIIATETVRGRTRYKVAGSGFEVWLDSTAVREASLGDVNENNSTTLPYNPEPQYPTDMWSHETTIQPGDYEIDADRRTSPSDSLSFDSERDTFPAPDPDLFAKKADRLQVGPWSNEDWEDAENYDPTDAYRNHPDSWSHEPTEDDYAEWEARHGKGKKAGLRSAGLMDDLKKWSGQHEWNDDNIKAWVRRHDPDYDRRHPEQAPELGSKYATWMLTAGAEGDDSVSRFRRDPIGEINRLGYLWTGGVEQPEMADYGRLVEADKMLREAAWADVRRKAQRLRREGRVHVLQKGPGTIYANVEGDHGYYTTMIAKTGHTQSIDKWACSCEWGKWAFQRKISYVGRLCSHGYASYLEMQSDDHKGNPGRFHAPKRTASLVDDFQDYVDDFREGNVDIDAVDNFITLPEHTNPRLDADQVDELYDWAWDNRTEREPRNFKMPYMAAAEEAAPRLRTTPRSLTPDLIVVPGPEESYFTDVEEDERETTGPGQIMYKEAGPLRDFIRNVVTKDKDLVSRQEALDWYGSLQPHEKDWVRENHPDHYVVRMDNKANGLDSGYRHAHLVDALGNPYTPGGFWRTADETVVEDEDQGGLAEPGVATPRVPEAAPPAPAAEAPLGNDEESAVDPMMGGGFDLGSFTEMAGPVIDTMSSFAAPIAEGIGSAIGNIGSGLGRLSARTADCEHGGPELDAKIEYLRGLTEDEADLGNTREQNDEIRDAVDYLHDHGLNVSPIVASRRLLAECCEGCGCDPEDCCCDEGSHKQANYDSGPATVFGGPPGGAFGQPGGGPWADRSYSGSGPDPKWWYSTSEEPIAEYLDGEGVDQVDVTEGEGETNYLSESDRPAQGKSARRFLFAEDNDMRDELLQSVGEEIEGIGQYNEFLDEAHEVGDEDAADAIEEAIADEADHVENFTEALHTAGMNDVVRRFQASGGGALAADSGGGNHSDDAIAGQARKFLAKTAGRVYSLAEQQELIEESHPGGARNKPTEDDLRGTHYV